MFILESPKFTLTATFAQDFGDPGVTQVLDALQEKMDNCPDCVDKFSGTWLRRLRKESNAIQLKAHSAGQTVLSVLPVATTAVERKHLYGEEVLPKRRRGRAVYPK